MTPHLIAALMALAAQPSEDRKPAPGAPAAASPRCGPTVPGAQAVAHAEARVEGVLRRAADGAFDPAGFGPELREWLTSQDLPQGWLTRDRAAPPDQPFGARHTQGVRGWMDRAQVRAAWAGPDGARIARSFTLICRDGDWREEGVWLEPEGVGLRVPPPGS